MREGIKSVLKRFFSTNPGIRIMRFLIRQFNRIENLYLGWRHGWEITKEISTIGAETELLVTNNEAFQIYSAAKSATKLPGDFAEVGTYKGGSAKLICLAKGDKNLYLFDTFEGLPKKGEFDKYLEEGQFKSSYQTVEKYLASYDNVFIVKGFFPETGQTVKHKKFSFVHIDVDFYQSTLDTLIFFYPLMVSGGIILSHDYATLPGVKKAFDEFFQSRPEVVIPLDSSQCLVVKN